MKQKTVFLCGDCGYESPVSYTHLDVYKRQVQGYASEDYAAENRKLVAYMERLSEGYTESQLARLTDIFVACSRLSLIHI